jgi:hypothetical protein
LTSAAANSAGGINAPPTTTSDAAPKTPCLFASRLRQPFGAGLSRADRNMNRLLRSKLPNQRLLPTALRRPLLPAPSLLLLRRRARRLRRLRSTASAPATFLIYASSTACRANPRSTP